MERGPEHESDFQMLPDSSLPCVWMQAGVLTYRLCDRGYDCEHCPLDTALRGIEPATAVMPLATAAPPAPWVIRDDRRYDLAGGWVADAADGHLRWGIDGFAAGLLDRITSVVLPVAGAVLERGRTACWVADDGELLPLRSPLSGTVIRTNQAAQRDPTLVMTSPYEAGWLVEVRSSQPLGELPGLLSPESRRGAAVRQLTKLRRAAGRRLGVEPGVGPTAADGGERLTDLRRILGTRRYHRLLLTILR